MPIAGLALLFALAVAPEPEEVTLSPPAFEGDLEAHWKREIERGIREGFSRGVPVTDGSGASLVVSSRVRVVEKDFTIELEVADAREGAVLATARDTCGLCGAQEAAEMAKDLASILRAKVEAMAKAKPALFVWSNPPAARVTIDGRPAGVTPLQIEVEEGAHTVRLEKSGYVAETRTVTGVAGVRDNLRVHLAVMRRDWRSTAWVSGWASLGVGLAAVGAGATLLAIDDRPYRAECQADSDGDCRNLYDTKTGGIVAVGAGAAATIAGAVLVVVARQRRAHTPVTGRIRFLPARGGMAIEF